MSEAGKKIQRWECRLADPEECGDGWCDDMAEMRESETGDYILYADHRAALIGELNGLAASFNERSCRSTEEIATVLQSVNRHIHARIAELEKEGRC